jgi:hypothetical protein
MSNTKINGNDPAYPHFKVDEDGYVKHIDEPTNP